MAETTSLPGAPQPSKLWKGVFAVAGIMTTLVTYGVLQEKIMRVPYGDDKAFFKYSLFLVFCNRITTSAVSAGVLWARKKALDPVAPVYKYGLVSISNILTTTCQYEALKYVSFPVQTLAKCAKMIPVMVWGTIIMQKKYSVPHYFLAFLVTVGCSIFILYPAGSADIGPSDIYGRGRENTTWGISLMIGYLGMTGLLLQGQLLPAIHFVASHNGCFFDIALLSTVATASQFFISYTIRTFGALTFATIMTTRQLASIMLSCLWFSHPLSWEQWMGAAIVFGSLYAKSFLRTNPSPSQQIQNGASSPVKGIP